MVVNAMNLLVADSRDLYDRNQRHRVDALIHTEQQCFDDGQRERDLEIKRCAFTRRGANGDRTFETIQNRLHYIHAYAATGDCGDLIGGTPSRPEYTIHGLCLPPPSCSR